jgi:hypothetical protein
VNTIVRITYIFEIADNNLYTKFLSATLSVSKLLFIAVKPIAKGKFLYSAFHETLIYASSVDLVNNNNISSQI